MKIITVEQIVGVIITLSGTVKIMVDAEIDITTIHMDIVVCKVIRGLLDESTSASVIMFKQYDIDNHSNFKCVITAQY